MSNNGKIAAFIAGFIFVGLFTAIVFPGETDRNPDAQIRIGAGNDVSGILAAETVEELGGTYVSSETVENSSFQDC